jgi:hypothetical protein
MVGYAGRSWNRGYVDNVFNLGYPWKDVNNNSIPDHPGEYLRTCTAEIFKYSTDVFGMGCNWGAGISGGAWMLGYAQAALSGSIDSVNSGIYIGKQNIYGIHFTSNNIVPICSTRHC